MTHKNAALLALIVTILMTAFLVWAFVPTFLNVLRDLVPAVTLFSSFIYAFGCFSVAVFFYIFHRAQALFGAAGESEGQRRATITTTGGWPRAGPSLNCFPMLSLHPRTLRRQKHKSDAPELGTSPLLSNHKFVS